MPECSPTKERRPVCIIHSDSKYSEKYDSYYCPITLQWLSSSCNDEKCSFCKDRPKNAKKEVIE